MRNWNLTGKIKAILLSLLSIPNLVNPIRPDWINFNFLMILAPFIFGMIIIPMITKVMSNFGAQINKPTWNDNPLTLKKPLNFFHFASFFMLTAGLSMTLGTLFEYQGIIPIGLMAISYGTGILIGIHLTIRFFGQEKRA